VRHRKKVPIRVDGGNASSTDASSWSSYDRAMGSEVGDGPGFVLNGDGVVCLDVDDCIVDGIFTPTATYIRDLFRGTAIEVSVSGRGLHVWGFASCMTQFPMLNGKRLEVYSDKRYLTVSGKWLDRSELADISDGLKALGCAMGRQGE